MFRSVILNKNLTVTAMNAILIFFLKICRCEHIEAIQLGFETKYHSIASIHSQRVTMALN